MMVRTRLRAHATILPFAILCCGRSVDAAEWMSVRTPHFVVLSEARPADVRATALQLEQFSEATAVLFPALISGLGASPTAVIVFGSASSYERFLSHPDGGRPPEANVYVRQFDGVTYLIMKPGNRDLVTARARNALIAFSVTRFLPGAPPWFVQGITDYLSTFEVAGNQGRIGRAIPSHIARLRSGQMPLSELFSVRSENSYGTSNRLGLFVAQSWLLMHYAAMGKPERFTPLLRFARQVAEGQSSETTFTEIFGYEMAALERELGDYLRRPWLQYQVVNFARPLPTTAPEPKRLDPDDPRATLLLAAAALQVGNVEEAKRLLTPLSTQTADSGLREAASQLMTAN